MDNVVGVRLAALMNEAELSAYRLAQLTGTSRSYICRVLKGERLNPSGRVLIRWSKALGCPAAYFLEEV
jgi:transcriptional regulator with XRE-family HTH domain